MTFPRWCYDDPSKHVDFLRRKREQYEASQENKAEKARQELEKLFKNGEALNEQN